MTEKFNAKLKSLRKENILAKLEANGITGNTEIVDLRITEVRKDVVFYIIGDEDILLGFFNPTNFNNLPNKKIIEKTIKQHKRVLKRGEKNKER